MASLCELTTCGTRSLANFVINVSCDSIRDTASAMMPRTMIRTTANASPNLVPIFKLPRNIVLLLTLGAKRGCHNESLRCGKRP